MMEHLVPVFHATSIPIDGSSKTVKANSGLDLSFGITMGPDGQSVWYTKPEDNKIARLTPI
jgi:streptogramin lyase